MLAKRLLVLLKPFDPNPGHEHELAAAAAGAVSSSFNHHKAFSFLRDRMIVHKNAVNYCLEILKKKVARSIVCHRSELSQTIRDVDLVVAIGGDGTLLHASNFMDDSVPLLGVNSDPTIPEEVSENREQFDARRSAGYLCAATAKNFEQVLDGILENHSQPSELSRIAININSKTIPTCALNDILLAHPCPASASRFSFSIAENEKPRTPLLHARSSGLRVSTATGSTAAMLSAGGSIMPILSRELQYMVREPMLDGPTSAPSMHGFIKEDDTMDITWWCEAGCVYIDGSNVVHPVQHGDNIRISSSTASKLKMFLPPHLLSRNGRG